MPTTRMSGPVCLGDVAKLFLGATVIDRKEILLHEVEVKLIETMTPADNIKNHFRCCSRSRMLGYWSKGGAGNVRQGIVSCFGPR